MANTPKKSSDTPTRDPEAQYLVHVAEQVDLLGERLYPCRDYHLRGDVLITIEASVADATQL